MSSNSNYLSQVSSEYVNEPQAQDLIKLKDMDDDEKEFFAMLLSGNYNEKYRSLLNNYSYINEDVRGMYYICNYLRSYSSFTENDAMKFITELINERKKNYPNDSLQNGYYNVINTSDVEVTGRFLSKIFGKTDDDDKSMISHVSSSSNNYSNYDKKSVSNIRKRIRKPIIVNDLGYDADKVAKLHNKGDSSPESGYYSSLASSPTIYKSAKTELMKREPILSSIYNYNLATNQSYITSIYDMDIELIIYEAENKTNANEETIQNLYKQKNHIEAKAQLISSQSRGGYYKTRKRNRKKRKNKSKKHYKKK